MPQEKEYFEFRISPRRLLVGLLLAVIPSVAGLYSISRSHKLHESAVGGHYRTIAESTAAAISQYIHDRVVEVAVITAEPAILDAVVAGNRLYQGVPEAAIAARIQKIDKEWNTPAGNAKVQEILSSRASVSLRRRQELDPRILRITVTDAMGAVVAASHKTLDYYQADEDYWTNIYAEGRGATSLTGVLYDEATRKHYIGVGIPIMETSSGRFIGTVDALVDVATLFPLVSRVQLGESGRTLLVGDDGMVIAGLRSGAPMKVKAEEYEAVQEYGSGSGRSGHVVAGIRGSGNNLIGFAETDLGRHYRALNWTVLVAKEKGEAMASVRTVERLIAFMSLLGLALVTLAFVFFSLHRKQPYTDIGELREHRSTQAAGGA
jgi:hypothetical protein